MQYLKLFYERRQSLSTTIYCMKGSLCIMYLKILSYITNQNYQYFDIFLMNTYTAPRTTKWQESQMRPTHSYDILIRWKQTETAGKERPLQWSFLACCLRWFRSYQNIIRTCRSHLTLLSLCSSWCSVCVQLRQQPPTYSGLTCFSLSFFSSLFSSSSPSAPWLSSVSLASFPASFPASLETSLSMT